MPIQAPTRVYRNWMADSRRWSAYRPRSGDVVIATYPKSGTTWMQQVVGLLIFQSAEPRPVTQIAPWLDRRSAPIEQVIALLEAQEHRRFIKSHMPFDAMPIHDEVRYIHVARDGRDACMSFHNHCVGMSDANLVIADATGQADETLGQPYPRAPQEPDAFFHRWLTERFGEHPDGMPFGSWFDFELSYWKQQARKNLLMVHYRDLKADLEGEMRRIASFLDIEIREALWPVLVKAASFSEMRRNADTLNPVALKSFIGGNERFFHKGENERWRGAFAEADLALFEGMVAERLPADCARWLEKGRLGTLV